MGKKRIIKIPKILSMVCPLCGKKSRRLTNYLGKLLRSLLAQ